MRYATIQIHYQSDDARSVPRYAKQAGGTVRSHSQAPIDVRLVNISTDGIGFETDVPLVTGTNITIGVSGIPSRSATIVRQDAILYGCLFHQPISPAEVARAGELNTVEFPAASYQMSAPLPHIDKWPRQVSLAILLGGTAVAWSLLVLIVHAVRG